MKLIKNKNGLYIIESYESHKKIREKAQKVLKSWT